MSRQESKRGLLVIFVIALIYVAVAMAASEGPAPTAPSSPERPDCPGGVCPLEPEWGPQASKLADIPHVMRQGNWSKKCCKKGSCVHAATITLLQWQGEYELAEDWRQSFHGGEYTPRLLQRLDQKGVRYSYTDTGEIEFLEWATRNRYGAGVLYFPNHAVNIVDLTPTHAVLIDSNKPGNYIYVERSTFVDKWRNEFHGFAWTVVYQPPPPTPTW